MHLTTTEASDVSPRTTCASAADDSTSTGRISGNELCQAAARAGSRTIQGTTIRGTTTPRRGTTARRAR